MVKVWLTVAVVVVLFAVWVWWLSSYRGVAREDLREHLEWLLECAMPGSFVEIQEEGSPKTVRFVMKAALEGVAALDLQLPTASWSGRQLADLESALRAIGYEASLDLSGGQSTSHVGVGLTISDVEHAHEVALVALNALSVSPTSSFRVRIRGKNRPDRYKLIGRPTVTTHRLDRNDSGSDADGEHDH